MPQKLMFRMSLWLAKWLSMWQCLFFNQTEGLPQEEVSGESLSMSAGSLPQVHENNLM
jgi:hypothetical protein